MRDDALEVQSEPLESIEAVAEVLKTALEGAKRQLAEGEKNVRFSLLSGLISELPGSHRKGTMVRGGDLARLENIQIPNMHPQVAIERGLAQVLGERRELPADASSKNLYVVECDFLLGNKILSLRIGKIDSRDDAFDAVAHGYRRVLSEPRRPNIREIEEYEVPDKSLRRVPGVFSLRNFFLIESTPPRIAFWDFEHTGISCRRIAEIEEYVTKVNVDNMRLNARQREANIPPSHPIYLYHEDARRHKAERDCYLKHQDEAAQGLMSLNDQKAGTPSQLIWLAGMSDREYATNAFSFYGPTPEGRYFIIEGPTTKAPRAELQDESPVVDRVSAVLQG